MHSRRSFLKEAFAAAMVVALFDPLKKVYAVKRHNKLPEWSELIEYARWCPTVHNLQPHKLKIVSETEADLFYDPRRLLPIGDPDSVFATVAMGVFLEHLSIAASVHGYKVVVIESFTPIKNAGEVPVLFAKLKLTPATRTEEIDRELILKRRTSRGHFNGKPLNPDTLSKIKSEVERSGHEFFFTNDKTMVEEVISMNQETLFEDLHSKENCRELDHLFRYSKKEAASHRDGLWSKCMGFPGALMRSVFQHPEKWHKGNKEKLLADHYKASFKGTETICWFGSRFKNPDDWLLAGRMFARTWLIMTREKAYIQPFGSLITNKNAYEKINLKFTQPGTDKKIWLIFRAGYSDEPCRSFRLSTAEIIIN